MIAIVCVFSLAHTVSAIEECAIFGLVVTTRPRGGDKMPPPIRTQIETFIDVHATAFMCQKSSESERSLCWFINETGFVNNLLQRETIVGLHGSGALQRSRDRSLAPKPPVA